MSNKKFGRSLWSNNRQELEEFFHINFSVKSIWRFLVDISTIALAAYAITLGLKQIKLAENDTSQQEQINEIKKVLLPWFVSHAPIKYSKGVIRETRTTALIF